LDGCSGAGKRTDRAVGPIEQHDVPDATIPDARQAINPALRTLEAWALRAITESLPDAAVVLARARRAHYHGGLESAVAAWMSKPQL
jgi:hypothetical protein